MSHVFLSTSAIATRYIDNHFRNEIHKHVVWLNNVPSRCILLPATQKVVWGGTTGVSTHTTTELAIIISLKQLNGNVCASVRVFVSLCLQRKRTVYVSLLLFEALFFWADSEYHWF